MYRPILLAALGWIALTGVASAQQPEKAIGVRDSTPEKPARVYTHLHALCIGINDYASPDIPDLSYAEADARDVADVLRTLYGFDDVHLLIGHDATKKRISDAISELFDPTRVGRDDCVVIFFSGHGQTVRQGDSEGGYLIPQDAIISLADVKNPAPYRRDALRMDDLRTDADGVPAKHVLFLLDACYSGYLAARTVEASPDLAAALKYPARQVITAGTAGEQSVEHNAWGHGALTYKLLEILRTEDRPIQASRLGVMLKERVPKEVSARFGKTRSLSPQAKYLSGDGDLLFVRPGSLTGLLAQPTGSGTDASTMNALALLKQGDQRIIQNLVSAGQYQEASDKLSSYEKAYARDSFSDNLRMALAERLVPTSQRASTSRPAPGKTEELLPLELISSNSKPGGGTTPTAPPPTATNRGVDTSKPRAATRAKRVGINLNGPVGPAPHLVTYSVDLSPQVIAEADFLWMDNGVWMGDEPSGSIELKSPGLHKISVLVITRDNQEFRGAATVNVLNRNGS